MQSKAKWEVRCLFWIVIAIFVLFLVFPLVMLLAKLSPEDGGFSLDVISQILASGRFRESYLNSFVISGTAALITTILSFLFAYSVNQTNLSSRYTRVLELMVVVPMFIPTITYGFAIMYTFGKAGLLSRLLGINLPDIYGFNGMLLGYVIYTLPMGFLLLSNSMKYVDKSFAVVSRVMGDSPFRTFISTALRPVVGTVGMVFIQSFALCFTDFGIPASLSGKYNVVATHLYNEMLGAAPNFPSGAAISLLMLLPAVFSIILIIQLGRYSFRYNKISRTPLPSSRIKDVMLGGVSLGFVLIIPLTFASVMIVPFMKQWPYNMSLTLDNLTGMFRYGDLLTVFGNSLLVALATALAGTGVAFAAALVVARSSLNSWFKRAIETISMISNTVPGMVLGIAFLFCFSGTTLQNTFFLLIICNIVHFFTTPYLMGKSSLEKMNAGWEATGELMGDCWLKTMFRVILPNSKSTILEMFGYFFINSMITISAVIFLSGSKTATMTTKIKELQHFSKYNEIFLLSLLILVTNVGMRILLNRLEKRKGLQPVTTTIMP